MRKKIKITKNLKCAYCSLFINESHTVYKKACTYRAASSGQRLVFCSKGHGLSYRHANLTEKQKEAYVAKIVESRVMRSSKEKASSRAKLLATRAKFSEEKKVDIAKRTLETFHSKGVDYARSVVKKREQTLIKNHGEDYGKIRHKIYKKTMQERYGVSNAWSKGSEGRKKCEATNLEKYGLKNPTAHPEIQARQQATYIANNGGLGWASPVVKEKYIESIRTRYGTDNPMQNSNIVAKVRNSFVVNRGAEKSRSTKEQNGSTPKDVAWKGHFTKKKNGSYLTSSHELYILNKLRTLYPKIEHSYSSHPDYPWNADFYDPDSGTIFEHQGYFTHGTEPYDDKNKVHCKLKLTLQKEKAKWASKVTLKVWTQTDVEKRNTCKIKGIPFIEWFTLNQFDSWYDKQVANLLGSDKYHSGCFRTPYGYVMYHDSKYIGKPKEKALIIYPWDNINKIGALANKDRNSIPARKTNIVEVTLKTANKFCDLFHIQGSCRGTKLSVGLAYEDKLIALMTFGKPRYNSGYKYELLRLCFRAGITVPGGAERMWKYAMKILSTPTVISYCDLSKFDGRTYERLGFTSKSTGTRESVHWYNPISGQRISNNLLLRHGFDRLIGKKLGIVYGIGTSNEILMKKHKFIPIQDQGQKSFFFVPNKSFTG